MWLNPPSCEALQAYPKTLGPHGAHGMVLINKWELNFKTAMKRNKKDCQGLISFPSNPDEWKRKTRKTQEREIMPCTIPVCQEPTHETLPMTRSWGRKPDRQGGSGFQGFQKGQLTRSHPWQGHEEKAWQARQIRFSGISKSCPQCSP